VRVIGSANESAWWPCHVVHADGMQRHLRSAPLPSHRIGAGGSHALVMRLSSADQIMTISMMMMAIATLMANRRNHSKIGARCA